MPQRRQRQRQEGHGPAREGLERRVRRVLRLRADVEPVLHHRGPLRPRARPAPDDRGPLRRHRARDRHLPALPPRPGHVVHRSPRIRCDAARRHYPRAQWLERRRGLDRAHRQRQSCGDRRVRQRRDDRDGPRTVPRRRVPQRHADHAQRRLHNYRGWHLGDLPAVVAYIDGGGYTADVALQRVHEPLQPQRGDCECDRRERVAGCVEQVLRLRERRGAASAAHGRVPWKRSRVLGSACDDADDRGHVRGRQRAGADDAVPRPPKVVRHLTQLPQPGVKRHHPRAHWKREGQGRAHHRKRKPRTPHRLRQRCCERHCDGFFRRQCAAIGGHKRRRRAGHAQGGHAHGDDEARGDGADRREPRYAHDYCGRLRDPEADEHAPCDVAPGGSVGGRLHVLLLVPDAVCRGHIGARSPPRSLLDLQWRSRDGDVCGAAHQQRHDSCALHSHGLERPHLLLQQHGRHRVGGDRARERERRRQRVV
eukprot:Opistho-1_new@34605